MRRSSTGIVATALYLIVEKPAWRRPFKPVMAAQACAAVMVREVEGAAAQAGALEAYELGLGEPVAISAEHGEGLADLYAALRAALPDATAAPADAEPGDVAGERESVASPIRIAVVGRPNSGKSTLVNRLLGEERLLTGPEAGITRDAIAVDVTWDDRRFRVHDTAGLRRRAETTTPAKRVRTESTWDAWLITRCGWSGKSACSIR